MSTARTFKVENRLAKLVVMPGGKTLAEALRSAQTKIEAKREDCIAGLEGQVSRLQTYAASGRIGALGPSLEGLYNVGNEIFGIAAAFELTDLAEAAYSLCDLVDHFREAGEASWPAVAVHIDGIRLLIAGSGVGGESIVAGLRQVSARFSN